MSENEEIKQNSEVCTFIQPKKKNPNIRKHNFEATVTDNDKDSSIVRTVKIAKTSVLDSSSNKKKRIRGFNL